MSPQTRSATRLGSGLVLVLCLMGGIAGADDALVSPPQVVAYCEGRTAHLPSEDRELAAASCRIIANGASESLARKDLAGAVEQIRALDERLRPRVVPPEPVRCPPPPACPAQTICPAPRVCAPTPDPIACRPREPVAAPVKRVRPGRGEQRNPFVDAQAPSPSKERILGDPFPQAQPPSRSRPPVTTPKKRQGRDLMDPFPHPSNF